MHGSVPGATAGVLGDHAGWRARGPRRADRSGIIALAMPSEFLQRQVDSLLEEAAKAVPSRDWDAVLELARAVLAIDPDNEDARGLLAMTAAAREEGHPVNGPATAAPARPAPDGRR